MTCLYTEGNRQTVIFLLSSANYNNVNAIPKTDQITNFSRKLLQEFVILGNNYYLIFVL